MTNRKEETNHRYRSISCSIKSMWIRFWKTCFIKKNWKIEKFEKLKTINTGLRRLYWRYPVVWYTWWIFYFTLKSQYVCGSMCGTDRLIRRTIVRNNVWNTKTKIASQNLQSFRRNNRSSVYDFSVKVDCKNTFQ